MLKSKFLLMRLVAVLGSALTGLTFAISASALNPETVPVEVEFVGPIILTLNNPLQFGLVDENIPLNDLITIAPNGTVTDLGPSNPPNLIGTGLTAAADLTVTAAVGRAITILVDLITPQTGYTLETFMCNYNVPDAACDGPGLGVTSSANENLTIGATLRGDGAALGQGVSDGSFRVTITYD